ncbi:hypothetical protein [Streptomyces sp. NPDC056255]|uniref:hypothetical protein n=1 Tax=Streptomyces sp. NPDC056255 TaxID=3345764 RepID=UPI0035D7BD86
MSWVMRCAPIGAAAHVIRLIALFAGAGMHADSWTEVVDEQRHRRVIRDPYAHLVAVL